MISKGVDSQGSKLNYKKYMLAQKMGSVRGVNPVYEVVHESRPKIVTKIMAFH